MKLPKEFYTQNDTLKIARELLGKTLVVPDENGRRVSGMIVETEAYQGPADKAAHSHNNRRTKRTEVMYAQGGIVYVFFVYGMYFQFNVVTGKEDVPHAILIRAVEPIDGIEIMRSRRGKMPDKNLTSGPGKLCIAFGIDKGFNGEDLSGDMVWIEDGEPLSDDRVVCGRRIGIDYAEEYAEKNWRFYLEGNNFISR
ncbi:MAG: DNA-3-methyladenine glycosylase [Acidobacteria bacterium]|nr:DNA-3-methyladenine glycosylase [Acidobacteriota bacterium]